MRTERCSLVVGCELESDVFAEFEADELMRRCTPKRHLEVTGGRNRENKIVLPRRRVGGIEIRPAETGNLKPLGLESESATTPYLLKLLIGDAEVSVAV